MASSSPSYDSRQPVASGSPKPPTALQTAEEKDCFGCRVTGGAIGVLAGG